MKTAKAAVAAAGTVVTALTAILADDVFTINEVGSLAATVIPLAVTVYAVWRVPNAADGGGEHKLPETGSVG